MIELLGSIHIIQTPSDSRKPTRVAAALTQRLASLREDLEAVAADAPPADASPPPAAVRQPSDVAMRELEQYITQRPKVRPFPVYPTCMSLLVAATRLTTGGGGDRQCPVGSNTD